MFDGAIMLFFVNISLAFEGNSAALVNPIEAGNKIPPIFWNSDADPEIPGALPVV